MKLLLDTSVAYWLLTSNANRIAAPAIDALEDRGNVVHLSAVTYLEIAIKRRLGKLPLREDDWPQLLARLGFDPLPVTVAHACAVEHLPAVHADPFDRVLVAQARAEGLAIVTPDRMIGRYDVATVW